MSSTSLGVILIKKLNIIGKIKKYTNKVPAKNKIKPKNIAKRTNCFSFLYSPGETKFQIWPKIKGREIIKAQYAVILKGTIKVAVSFVEITDPFNRINWSNNG
jgi:hypothetical protein